MSIKTLLKDYIVLPALRYLEADSSGGKGKPNVVAASASYQGNQRYDSDDDGGDGPGTGGGPGGLPDICHHLDTTCNP